MCDRLGQLRHADAEPLGLAVERDLAESGIEEPLTDHRSQVRLGATARPDDGATRTQHPRCRRNGRCDVALGNIAEDPAQHEQVDRQGQRKGCRIASIAGEDSHLTKPEPAGNRPSILRQPRVLLDQNGPRRFPAGVGKFWKEITAVT